MERSPAHGSRQLKIIDHVENRVLSNATMNQDLAAYYRDRAKEYDKVYLNPPEQDDLLTAARLFQNLFSQKVILEIACGTGYWTEKIAQTAASVDATDINEQVIEIARERPMPGKVTFSTADMYDLMPGNIQYDGLFGGFIWSHILLQDLDVLMDRWSGFLKEGGTMVFIDSNPVENTPHDTRNITETDEHGNTYQTRTLENGTRHRVLKNFPTPEFLFQKLSRAGTDIEIVHLTHYWIATCKRKTTKNAPASNTEKK